MRDLIENALNLETRPYTDADAEWDEFVAGHPHGSILQTTAWAMLKGRFGWTPQRVWLKKEGKLIAGAQMLVRSVALGPASHQGQRLAAGRSGQGACLPHALPACTAQVTARF